MKKLTPAMQIIIPSVAIVCLAFAGAGWAIWRKGAAARIIAPMHSEMRSMAVALEGLFVDDCGDSNPDEGNMLPRKLTTPVAYLTKRPADPFSPSHEPYHYYNVKRGSNGSNYLIVSAGPDGVLDMERITERESWPVPIRLKPGTAYVRWMDSKIFERYSAMSYGYWIQNCDAYKLSDNMEVKAPRYGYIFLPRSTMNSTDSKQEALDFLAKYGVPIYDATNGSRSQGDIIYFSWSHGL